MARFIPDEVVDEVRQRNEIGSVIASYLPLKRSGRGFKALCPFHNEKTPSFNINTEKQIYHCFGCGKGGNVFTFVMEIDRLSFPEAVEHLAQRAGVAIPQASGTASPRREEEKGLLFRANEWAANIFAQVLASSEGSGVMQYLAGRGISQESVRKFRLGCAPDAWDTLVRKLVGKEAYLAALQKAGLVIERGSAGGEENKNKGRGYYDRFRNRLIFPILDVQERVVGFGARSMDGSEPKYLNSPETPIFNKSRMLYGLPLAREAAKSTGRLVITEGYTDVIMAHQKGFCNFVATLGTALTPQHVPLVRRYADEAVVLYDGDSAGRNAAARSVELFLEGEMPARFAALPAGEDPCSLLAAGKDAELTAALEAAQEPIDFLLANAEEKDGSGDRPVRSLLEKKSSLIERVIDLVARVPSPVRRELLIKDLSEKTGLSEQAIRQRLGAIRTGAGRRPAVTERSVQNEGIEPLDEYLMEVTLMAPSLRRKIRESGVVQKLKNDEVRSLCEWMLERDDTDLSGLMCRVENPHLVSIIAALGDRSGHEPDYQKALDDCMRRLQHDETAELAARLNRELIRASAEGDEERQIELLKEIHRVHDNRIRSVND